MASKKILFISSWYPNQLESTNGNFVQRHAEAVSLLNHVEVLHSIGVKGQKEKILFDDKLINGIRTLIVYYKKSKNPVINFLRRFRSYQKGFLKLSFPDLVHANILQNTMLFAVYLKKKYQIPFVVSEHWSGLLKINRHKISLSKLKIAKFVANRADCVMPVSKMLQKELENSGIGKTFQVVENVVNTEVFKPLIINKVKDANFRFLHISNLVALKNPEKIISTAIQLHKNFENFELHIGGDGDYKKLEDLVLKNKADSFIKVFGEQTLSQVAEKMKNADCFVLFSDYENLPCVLLESMACGIPVISTNVGGVSEIVNPEVGILIDSNEDELYQAMKKILLHEQDFLTKTEMHQYIVKHFSTQQIAEKFDDIYNLVLKNYKQKIKSLFKFYI